MTPERPGRRPLPLAEIPAEIEHRLLELGGAPADLYRALAHSPELLHAWIEFAWSLRAGSTAPRSLRELMICRSAQLTRTAYQWRDHRPMALEAGVAAQQLDELAGWQRSAVFSDLERAALRLTEEVLADHVSDATWAELLRHVDPRAATELLLTAGFYAMVPRVLKALRLEPGPRDIDDPGWWR